MSEREPSVSPVKESISTQVYGDPRSGITVSVTCSIHVDGGSGWGGSAEALLMGEQVVRAGKIAAKMEQYLAESRTS